MKTKSKVRKPKKSNKLKESIPAYLQDSIIKNRDNLSLLVSYPKFKKEIQKLRIALDMPAEGFIGDNTYQDHAKWYGEFLKKSDEASQNRYFIKELRDISEKQKAKKISRFEAMALLKKLHLKIPANLLAQGKEDIIKKFNLPANYAFSIHQYLFYDKLVSQGSNYAIVTDASTKIQDAKFVTLHIYTKLTDGDLCLIKEDVNNIFGKKLPSYKNTANIETGIGIEKLSGEIEYDYADNTSYKLTNRDIAERILGSAKRENEIPKIKRNLKDLRQKRFTVL